MQVAEKAKEKLAGNNNKKLPATMKGLKSDGINKLLEVYRAQISLVIPKHIKADRIIQIITTVISRNPKLKECSVASVIGAVLQSAILGLDPTPELGECYFIPRLNNKTREFECNFMIGYQGMIQLALNTGEYETIYAYPVYENDKFNYCLGLEPKLEHTPAIDDRGDLTHVYVVWKFKDGGYYFEVLTKDDVYKARDKSESKDSKYSPWQQWEPEMWRKTAIRHSWKYVPRAIEKTKSMVRAMAADDRVIEPGNFSKLEKEFDLTTIPEPEPELKPEPKKIESEKKTEQDTIPGIGDEGAEPPEGE